MRCSCKFLETHNLLIVTIHWIVDHLLFSLMLWGLFTSSRIFQEQMKTTGGSYFKQLCITGQPSICQVDLGHKWKYLYVNWQKSLENMKMPLSMDKRALKNMKMLLCLYSQWTKEPWKNMKMPLCQWAIEPFEKQQTWGVTMLLY